MIERDKKGRFQKGSKGKDAGHWKGGIIKKSNGYLLAYAPNHPRNLNKYVYQHILIMEQYLGRFLNKEEIVHHVNGIKTDNRIENLELINKSIHINIHRTNWRKR